MKTSEFLKVVQECRVKMSELSGVTINLLEIDIYFCNGYIVLYYENNDITISCEISEFDNEFVVSGWDIQEA